MRGEVFKLKKALLLDMNNTFMFGEDRFGKDEDYSRHYKEIGGTLSKIEINEIITKVYEYLSERYPNEEYRHDFPSVEEAIEETLETELSREEINKIVDAFAFHEHGYIPDEYVKALFKLGGHFILSVVIDIWSRKKAWLETFERLGLDRLFSTSSFSSDHGMVKPSPKPFELILSQLRIPKEDCLVIGDCPRRDLGGARAAGIDCILIGGASDPEALGGYSNLLELCNE